MNNHNVIPEWQEFAAYSVGDIVSFRGEFFRVVFMGTGTSGDNGPKIRNEKSFMDGNFNGTADFERVRFVDGVCEVVPSKKANSTHWPDRP